MFRAGIRAECMEDVPIHFTGIHMYGIHVDRYIFRIRASRANDWRVALDHIFHLELQSEPVVNLMASHKALLRAYQTLVSFIKALLNPWVVVSHIFYFHPYLGK